MSSGYGKMGLGILLLAVALLTVSPSQGATITENFAGNQYNTDLWNLYQSGGTTAQVIHERLEVTVAGNGYAGLYGNGFTIKGDFDMQVDFTLINWPPNNLTQIAMGLQNESTNLGQVARANSPGGEQYFTIIMDTNNAIGVTDPPLSGTLRMVRAGNKVETFYKDGAAWNSIGSATNGALGSEARVSLGIGPYGNNYSGIPAKAAYDNILIDLNPGSKGNPGPGIMMLLDD
jgi:hypothetical protein